MTNNYFKAILAIDGYKTGHIRQYPENTEYVLVNWTPRSVKHATTNELCDDKIVNFGLQYVIKEILINNFNETFFSRAEEEVVAEFDRVMTAYLGKGAVGTDHIRALHRLGYLPISIMALPEGVAVNARVPMFTVINTHPDFAWVPGYLETVMSSHLWQACTSATIARKYRTVLDFYANKTGVAPGFTQFQGHDFSARGMHPGDSQAVSGMGHLLSFVGTDTVLALLAAEQYYRADMNKELVGCSVPATEHSVMCMGSAIGGEEALFLRYLTEVYPTGIVSIVSDTWDFWAIVTEFCAKHKETIMKRDGKFVIRPDSSPKTPLEIICGDPDATPGSPEFKGAVECLWEIFGGKINEKGYKELDSHIGLIYGDSITLNLANNILKRLAEKGFASNNVVLGIGSYTYAFNTRDTYGFAMKATAGTIAGEDVHVYKEPKTDSGMKASARGFLTVRKDKVTGEYILVDKLTREEYLTDTAFVEVFRDGKLLVDQTLAEIRERVAKR